MSHSSGISSLPTPSGYVQSKPPASCEFAMSGQSFQLELMAQGENAFQVNLVVLNTDGTLATDALLLNAVSLNFVE